MASIRHRAREAALQSLYAAHVGGLDPADAVEVVFANESLDDAPEKLRLFAEELVAGVSQEATALDAEISRAAEHWRIERLATLDRLILRLGVWELRHSTDTPPAVVIDEALELARTFSTDDSVRFVNGVLDAINRHVQRT